MNYDLDELFWFVETKYGYSIIEYLKKNDPSITELEIPAEYNGELVTVLDGNSFAHARYLKRVVIPPSIGVIGRNCFAGSKQLEAAELSEGLGIIDQSAFTKTKLKNVVLPKSLIRLRDGAFSNCTELESVTFNSNPTFGRSVFNNCPKLPADVTLMGLVNSCDLTQPLDESEYNSAFLFYVPGYILTNRVYVYARPDVLALAAKNDCFRSVDRFVLLKFLIDEGNEESLRVAGENGIFDTPELLDKCIDYSVQQRKPEITAYLLDLKKRKFGFNDFGEGDDFEL